MKVWDTFLFYNELDMLQCRLETLDEVVDRFVLCEGNITNAGQWKPSYYEDNLERFKPWADRIVHVWATGLPNGGWDCEYAKREWIRKGLEGARLKDLVLLSDVDEIPHPDAVRELRHDATDYVRFEHQLYCFAVDWLHPTPWIGTIAAPYWKVARTNSMQAMRNIRHVGFEYLPRLPGSWHFTWVGGTEQNYTKLNSSHDGDNWHHEAAQALLADNRYLREGRYFGNVKLAPVEVDATWPAHIYERRCPPSWFRAHHEAVV